MKKVISLLMCLCTFSIVWCNSAKVHAEEKEIVETHILTDEELSLLYTCKPDVRNDTCLTISQEDAERLMRIAVVEDHTDVESQAAVMMVVLNRVNSDVFPNSVEKVITQKGQFSTVSNGSYQKAEPNTDSHLALALIESGEYKSEKLFLVDSDGYWFESASARNTWQSKHRTYICTLGGTRYYR